MSHCKNSRIVVLKLGGSVLSNQESYGHAARFLVRRLHQCSRERLLVVVSAQYGHTEELEILARSVTDLPSRRTLDLLWPIGEIRSVALLALHLEALGIAVVGLNAHETGLRFGESVTGDHQLKPLATDLQQAFVESSIVVVPGFFATQDGMLVSLGRGGSDLSAVVLADELDADGCELIKDVGGYFDRDPNADGNALHLPNVSYKRALAMAEAGCDLVQPQALETARRSSLRLVIRSFDDHASSSVVSEDGNG